MSERALIGTIDATAEAWQDRSRSTRRAITQRRMENDGSPAAGAIPRTEISRWIVEIWYRIDEEQADGSIRRVQKTKILGRKEDGMTLTQAKKEAGRFMQPINDVVEGIEHRRKTMRHLIAKWREAVKPNLKLSTQMSYEWAFKRLEPTFGHVALADIGKADIQAFLTSTGKQLSGESVRDLRARLRGLLSTAEQWGWIEAGGNPAGGRLRLPEPVPARPRRIIWPVEFHPLVATLKQPYGAIVSKLCAGSTPSSAGFWWSTRPHTGAR